jgi:hypothetical protein
MSALSDCVAYVRYWHKADMPTAAASVRFWGKNALAIPATAIPADALARVEPVRTGAVLIPMISGLAQPVATGIGLSRQ